MVQSLPASSPAAAAAGLRPPGNTPPPCGVIFDMDGLLVDSEPVHAAAYVFTFRHFGFALDPEEYRRRITLGGGSIRDLFRAKGGDLAIWDDVFAVKRERFRRHVVEELALLPGVEALLAALERRGTPCVLATGAGRANAEIVLGHFGLGRHFPTVLCGEDVRLAKPDPEVFVKAAGALGLPPGECVSLEDSPKGVRAAAAAGVPCVAVPTEWTRAGDFTEAALVAESLLQVTMGVLEGLYRRAE